MAFSSFARRMEALAICFWGDRTCTTRKGGAIPAIANRPEIQRDLIVNRRPTEWGFVEPRHHREIRTVPSLGSETSAVNAPRSDNRRLKSHTERIVRGNDAVWQYLDDGKKVYIFPLVKGERQRVVDEGPLPFLFKVRANEADARYQMSLVAENADKYLVKVLPKLKEDQESFKVAWLHLHKQFLLPTRITLVSPNGISSREYYLDRQRPNAPVDDQSFQGGVLPGWTVQKNPATEDLR
jgi:hypothetical protein